MRVLQLIDSLEAGGAERIAVTYANSLSLISKDSFLCVTRKEGILKNTLSEEVGYIYVKRKRTLDFQALKRLSNFVNFNKIDIIHAHTTSFFFGALVKICCPKIKLIWHEHQGNRILTSSRQNKLLFASSFFFDRIITVNSELELWCKKHLISKNVVRLSNFVKVSQSFNDKVEREKNIVCLANLKPPKNHLNLLQAFKIVNSKFPMWKLLLVGKDFMDDYSNDIEKYISDNKMEEAVCLLGAVGDVETVLRSATIGVLSSDNEGLPMAILEYGASGLAAVVTNVGDCERVVSGYGKLVEPQDANALSRAIIDYIENEDRRLEDAKQYRNHIKTNFSLEAIFPMLMDIYKKTEN